MRTLFSDSKSRASFLDFSGTGNIKLNRGYEFWFTYALQLLVILKSCPATSKTFAVKLWYQYQAVDQLLLSNPGTILLMLKK